MSNLANIMALVQIVKICKPLVVIKGQNPRNDVEVIKFFDCDGQNVRAQ